MAQWEAKFDWPRDQFLRFRVQWPSERRVKCENGKLKRGSQLEFGILGMGREATSKPAPFADSAKSAAPARSKAGLRQVNYRMSCPSRFIAGAERSTRGNTVAQGWPTRRGGTSLGRGFPSWRVRQRRNMLRRDSVEDRRLAVRRRFSAKDHPYHRRAAAKERSSGEAKGCHPF
jgi:hypothetical protein